MSDAVKLGIHVDTSQIATATLALNDLTDAANRAAEALARLKGKEIDAVRTVSAVKGERIL